GVDGRPAGCVGKHRASGQPDAVNVRGPRADTPCGARNRGSRVDPPPPVCYGAAASWTGTHPGFDDRVLRRRKSLDTQRLTRTPNADPSANTTLDLGLSGAYRVKSFAFHRAARVTT